MKKKNGFNIMLFVFIIIFIMILSCVNSYINPSDGILLKTDSDFSEMSVKEGMFKAFLFYIAADGVVLRDGSFPLKGEENLKKSFLGKSDTSFVLRWEPVFENISDSGDLGYTYGIHTYTDKLTGAITKGTYVTIWKKQPDGNWKFVLDTGTDGLPENSQ